MTRNFDQSPASQSRRARVVLRCSRSRAAQRTVVKQSCATIVLLGYSGVSESVMPHEGDELLEIVVTAERREARLQSVPIRVSVVTGETALKSGITTSEDLALGVRGLQMDLNGVGLSPFLRGVGSDTKPHPKIPRKIAGLSTGTFGT
jgi:outer membrane receptor protein involved in Fe transport